MAKERNITTAAVLGSTGSVGLQTLNVADELGMDIKLLAAGRNTSLLASQIRKYSPKIAAVADEVSANRLKNELSENCAQTEILYKKDEVLSAIRETQADIVFHSVGGLAGLDYAYAAAESEIGRAHV